jgi:hypothetical protein
MQILCDAYFFCMRIFHSIFFFQLKLLGTLKFSFFVNGIYWFLLIIVHILFTCSCSPLSLHSFLCYLFPIGQ